MLFRQRFLEGVRKGTITVAFRRWRRPSVRTGGTLMTPVGQLNISSVSRVPVTAITPAAAKQAGYESLNALLNDLSRVKGGQIYRIVFGPLRPDPRTPLRESAVLTENARRDIFDRLQKMDRRSSDGPWTQRTLALIRSHPGVRADDLCRRIRQDKERFKLNVRKLKNLGLTESLGTGYRPSPRGHALIRTNGQGPKELVRTWVEAFNRADVDALTDLYSDKAINHQVADRPVEGREAIQRMFVEGFATAKMVCIVENLFEDGEWAILEWRDPLGLRGCGFFHVVNGKIVFQRGYWDKLSFLRLHRLPFPQS
jgi:hypothetical protein